MRRTLPWFLVALIGCGGDAVTQEGAGVDAGGGSNTADAAATDGGPGDVGVDVLADGGSLDTSGGDTLSDGAGQGWDAAVDTAPDALFDATADVAADAAPDVVEDVEVDAGSADVGADTAVDATPDAGPPPVGPTCFGEIWDPEVSGPDYDQFHPTLSSHCWGTNQQDIGTPGLVVFLGDSVTVGTPNLEHALPTDNEHFWRNKLATWLRDTYGLNDGGPIDFGLWKTYDLINGVSVKTFAGDLRSCAKWGARTDDLLEGGGQIGKCFPDGGSQEPTLVVFTMGGNDIAKIQQVGGDASDAEVAAGYPAAWAIAEETVAYLWDALWWLKDPQRFPNGSWVVFASPYEFTDGTGDISKCLAAGFAGFKPWKKPEVLEAIVIYILESYMDASVATQTDMIWMFEHFCGHGYAATGPNADPNNRCYRGPGTDLWFDDTCIHPSAAGHAAIYEMFRATIDE